MPFQKINSNASRMDQAASILSQPGKALHVSFYPKTSFEYVQFPTQHPQMVFLSAQSFVTAEKHVSAPKCYNLRVVECTLAAAVLATIHGVQVQQDASPLGISLRGFQESMNPYWREQKKETFEAQLEDLIRITNQSLQKPDGYTREEIASILGLSVQQLEEQYTNRFPIEAERFMLQQRALHVFSEALRVQRFKDALASDDSQLKKINCLGALMNETQASCRDLYDCSCPELDEICRIARAAGAKGSRLTGAGWGGCTVHLVSADQVDTVASALKNQYYERLGDVALREGLVVSEPGTGSYVISPDAQ
jgi:galactokinase